MTKLTTGIWEKLIGRWTTLDDSGEVRLVKAMLSLAITDEITDCVEQDRPIFKTLFFESGRFALWCKVIGVNPEFLLEQVIRAQEFEIADGVSA